MNAEELDAIEARVGAATEGPWTFGVMPVWEHTKIVSATATDSWEDEEGTMIAPVRVIDTVDSTDEDSEFIVHARADVAALVAEVRRLWAVVDVEAGETP